MKKHISTFLSGMLAAALVFSLGVTALASADQVAFGGVNVVLLGERVINADETLATSSGQNIPSSITYTDVSGGGTVYLPLRKVSELLDATVDYKGDEKTVYIGGIPSATGGIKVTLPDGTAIPIQGDGQKTIPSFTIDDINMGPFTRVDSKLPGDGEPALTLLAQAQFISKSDFDWSLPCLPDDGKYVSVTVTNNNVGSTEELIVNLFHNKAVGPKEAIPAVMVKPGETVTCTFEVKDAATVRNSDLGINITFATAAPYTMDVTVSAVQFA